MPNGWRSREWSEYRFITSVVNRDRAGQCSIRINDQWRVCFEWHDNRAVNIEIVDDL